MLEAVADDQLSELQSWGRHIHGRAGARNPTVEIGVVYWGWSIFPSIWGELGEILVTTIKRG